mmetsp:Transcript_5935/g.10113  ORF Transcript_5935/g.10113 Transcript_5935/m.10113 type:complete len:88 (+) Transcript_5935:219-482(+)
MCVGITTSGLMYTYYMKSTQENGAAKATVYNFSVNYLGSLIFGFLFFDEAVTPRTLLGFLLILGGTGLISTCSEEEERAVGQAKKAN